MQDAYRKRLFRTAGQNFWAFWSSHRLLVSLVALLGPVGLVWWQVFRYGIYSFQPIIEGLKSGVVVLISTLALGFLNSIRLAAEALDTDWQKTVALLEAERNSLKAELVKPKWTPFEQKLYEKTEQVLKTLGPDSIELLKALLEYEKIKTAIWHPPQPEHLGRRWETNNLEKVLGALYERGDLVDKLELNRDALGENVWTIVPTRIPILRALFYP